MEVLKTIMKNHNISLVSSSSNYSYQGHALSTSYFPFNATSTSSSNEWLIDSGESSHMAKDIVIFSS
jgi:hypothetical protein